MEEVEVAGAHVALEQHRLPDPAQQAAPVLLPDQHDRHRRDLLGLDQRQRLEHLVHRPEAAGEVDERGRVLHEVELAHEEVAEVQRDVLVRVGLLLLRQM